MNPRWLVAGIVIVASTVAAPDLSSAQEGPVPAANAVHLVVDTSGSMLDPDPSGRVKMEGAKSALLQFLDGAQLGTALGLRTYPDLNGGDCNSGRLRYPVERHDPADVSAVIRGLQPNGDTPTAEALLAAAEDIRASGFPSATLVLVSDGESTCADPCQAARDIVASGLNVQVIAVGFRISDVGAEELDCIASTTGGRYVDIDDSAELEQVLRDISVPRLSLSISHPDEVVAEVGFDGTGVVTVSAEVTNAGQTAAANTQVRLQFESASVGVVGPVRALGNIQPGSTSNRTTWTFRPGLLTAGTTIEFSVIVRADNMPSDIGQGGQVRVLDPVEASEAGTTLRNRRLAILGDSYSSGEGADNYLAGTDTTENSCHRSTQTYAAEVFNVADEAIIACSGAVTGHIDGPDFANDIPSQVDQLTDFQVRTSPVDAVVLSLGGNNVGFSQLARACVFGNCAESIGGKDSESFAADEFATIVAELVPAYEAIHDALNDASALRRRGNMAPLVVLGYPRPVPTTDRPCAGMGLDVTGLNIDFFDSAEVKFVNRFITDLNGYVEAAVIAARKGPSRIPVFYVPFVEDSFLPDHTVCDRQPYARGADSFNGAAVRANVTLSDFFVAINPFQTPRQKIEYVVKRYGEVVVDGVQRGIQELFHPNQLGYQAMTRALIRWSTSTEADGVAQFLRTVPPPDPGAFCTEITSPVPLDLATPLQVLSTCVPYQIRVEGFEPVGPVEVVVNSSPRNLGVFWSGIDGVVDATVMLPSDVEPGQHTLQVRGIGADSQRADRSLEFTIVAPTQDRLPLFAGVAGAGGLLSGAAMFALGGRRRKAAGSLS